MEKIIFKERFKIGEKASKLQNIFQNYRPQCIYVKKLIHLYDIFFMNLYDVIIPEESLGVEVVLVHVVVLLPDQVWTLTHLCSVDFYNQGRCKKCNFSKCKSTIKVCVSCCWRCPDTPATSEAHLMVSLYLCSSGSNARGESRAREGRCVSSKSPSKVWDGDEGVAWRNGREKCLPSEGSLICPALQANQWFLLQKGNRK